MDWDGMRCGEVSDMFVARPLLVSARAGAQTSVYCAVADELTAVSGKYLRRCRVSHQSARASDAALAAHLWHVRNVLTHTVTHLSLRSRERCKLLR